MCTAIFEVSELLDTGLKRESLEILVQLVEHGVNPVALAAVVQELRRERAGAARGLPPPHPGPAAPGARPPPAPAVLIILKPAYVRGGIRLRQRCFAEFLIVLKRSYVRGAIRVHQQSSPVNLHHKRYYYLGAISVTKK